MNTESVKGQRRDMTPDEFVAEGVAQPGDWCIVDHPDKQTDIWICFPGRRFSRIPVNDCEEWGSPCWRWDGNRDAPTLTPSIHLINEWHGYMTNGELRSV